MRTIRTPITALLLALGAGVACADTPVRVLTDDLRLERAELVEMDEAGAVLRRDGRPQRVALGPAASRVFVELTDGQRLIVDIDRSEDPEAIVGRVIGLGRGRIPLERVARIARPGAAWHAESPRADVVRLANGDVLTGFVDSIGESVSVETDAGGTAVVPLAGVAEIRLANPPEPAPGLLVTDDQGVALIARTLTVDADARLTLTTDPGVLGVDSRGEDTIAYERVNARLIGLRTVGDAAVLALGAIAPDAVRPTGGRRWTPAPERRSDDDPMTALPDVRMPAPASATYPLPAGTRFDRFACAVSPARPGPWTDCTARAFALSADGTRTLIGEQRITAATADAPIAGPVPPGTRAIILEVDPGASGAVQDAVTFLAPRVRAGD